MVLSNIELNSESGWQTSELSVVCHPLSEFRQYLVGVKSLSVTDKRLIMRSARSMCTFSICRRLMCFGAGFSQWIALDFWELPRLRCMHTIPCRHLVLLALLPVSSHAAAHCLSRLHSCLPGATFSNCIVCAPHTTGISCGLLARATRMQFEGKHRGASASCCFCLLERQTFRSREIYLHAVPCVFCIAVFRPVHRNGTEM